MHWVIQNNLFNEKAVEQLVEILDRHEIPYSLVKVIPFGGGIEPELKFNDNDKVVVIGSISLVRYAQKMGWKPGAWMNNNFNYEEYGLNLNSRLLNYGRYSVICKFRDVPLYFKQLHFQGEFFLRPLLDGKEFAGTVFSQHKFMEWYRQIIKGDSYYTVNEDTEVVMAEVKNLYSEYRFVVVNNTIVTGSKYKQGNRVVYDTDIPDDVKKYAADAVSFWTPAKVCVIDIARTDDGLKVVEFNNFNSAGWYNCDVSKIVQAIEALE